MVYRQHALVFSLSSCSCRFRSHGVAGYGGLYDFNGKKFLSLSSMEEAAAVKSANNAKKKTPFILGWHEVRHLLHHSLPPGIVLFGKQVSFYNIVCAV